MCIGTMPGLIVDFGQLALLAQPVVPGFWRLAPRSHDASALPAVQQRMQAYGVEPSKLTAEEFARFNLAESAKWLDVMRRARLEPN